MLIVATLWALGGHTPFYHIPYAIIPGTKFFRAPNSVFFVGTMAIAFLCAAGVEHALDLKVGKKYLYGWLGFGALIALLAPEGKLNLNMDDDIIAAVCVTADGKVRYNPPGAR